MADLVERIAGNVLGTVAVEDLKSELIRILRSGRYAAEFGILRP